VVDRNAECAVARELAARGDGARDDAVSIVVDEWSAFLDRWLGAAAASMEDDSTAANNDAIVPSPLMPHLLFDWVLHRARARWPHRTIERVPIGEPPPVPWQRASPGGTHYVSFAEWECPVNCIEPARCPVTRGARDWSLPVTLDRHANARRAGGDRLTGPLIFHCTHRVYGVGMIDVGDVVAADRTVAAAGTPGPARVLVGTTSHCHGALDLVAIPAERT
jgi:hypothetical protein